METEMVTMIAALATLGVAVVATILAWQTGRLLKGIKGWMKMTGMNSYVELMKKAHRADAARELKEQLMK